MGSLAARRFGDSGTSSMGSLADGAAVPDQLLHALVFQRLLGRRVRSRAVLFVELRSRGVRLPVSIGLRSVQQLQFVWQWWLCVGQLLDELGPRRNTQTDSEHR